MSWVERIDARGWIGLGEYLLTAVTLVALIVWPELAKDDFFQTIATIIITCFVKDVVGWAYSATKAGGELAANNAAIIAQQAGTSPPPPGGTGQ